MAVLLFAAGGAWAERTESRQCVVTPQASIRINNVAGEVIVSGWDREEVHLEARMDDRVEEMVFDCTESRVDLRFVYPKRIRDCKVYVTIQVPRGAKVEVETVSASIDASAFSGEVMLKSVSGDVDLLASACTRLEVQTISGNVELEASAPWLSVQSTSGRIELKGNAEELIASNTSGHIQLEGQYGTARLESVSGAIELKGSVQHAESRTVSGSTALGVIGLGGPGDAGVRVNSVSGKVELAGDGVRDLRVETISGRVGYEGRLSPGVRGEISTTSSAIELDLTGPLDAQVDARSNSGGVNAEDFGLRTTRGIGPGEHIDGVAGSGEGRLTLQSLSGSITLRSR
jgi:DUF4097 and DUF4098 domain-containing protein YvlB